MAVLGMAYWITEMEKVHYLGWVHKSENDSDMYVRFTTDEERDSCIIQLLEKIDAQDIGTYGSQCLDTQHPNFKKVLVCGAEPRYTHIEKGREVWNDRVGEGKWVPVQEYEVMFEVAP